jgi:DNA-binding response OmpR family regulator
MSNDTLSEPMPRRFDPEIKRKIQMEEIARACKNLKIAAIDDDFVIQELIKNTFKHIGTEVLSYSDGSDFMHVIEEEPFDLIFLDLMMPIKDGFDVLKELKNRDIRVPVIVLSAVTQRETVIRAFQMGIKSYITKPLKPEDLLVKTMEILRNNF